MKKFIPLSQHLDEIFRYLDEIIFKKYFPPKKTFLMTCKNYLVPARQDVFYSRDLVFTNEESLLSRMNLFNVVLPGKAGQIDVYAHT